MTAINNLQRIVGMRGTKAQVEAFTGALEEQAVAFASDTGEIGIYTNGAWAWISAGLALDDLTDVNASSPTDRQLLTWDDDPGEWIAETLTLDGVSDVNATDPSVGDVVAWTGSVWQKQDPNRLLDKAWGSMYQDDASTVVTIGATDTDYIVDGMSQGVVGSITFQNAKELKIAMAGVYKVDWSVSYTCAAANQETEAAVGIGGVRVASTSAHKKVLVGADTVNLSGTGLLELSIDDLVQIVVRNETGANNITIEHANLSLVFLGLTVGGAMVLENGDFMLLESGDNMLLEG